LREFVHAFTEGRLENDRKAATEPLDLGQAAGMKAGREINAERASAAIGQA
jgi:hypothetical protein